MACSDGCRALWDCSEDEAQFEDEESIEFAEMLPAAEQWFPDVTPETLAPDDPAAGQGGEMCMPMESEDAASPTTPELPSPASDEEPEPAAGVPEPVEPTAGMLRFLEPPVKRFRLRAKTSVPADVCLPIQSSHQQLRLPTAHSEEFLSKHFWAKLNTMQQYNYVYEKLRGFYVSKVHEGTLHGEAHARWSKLAGNVRQQEGRQAFKVMDADEKRQLARRWAELCSPPNHISKQIQELFQCVNGGRSARSSGSKTTSAMFTWFLPESFLDVSAVMGEGEPTASLDEVVERLRGSSSVVKAWGQLMDHGRRCMQQAGGEDIAICLEVCPETLQLQKVIRLHVHALIRSAATPLAIRHLWKFDLGEMRAHMSTGVRGVACTRGRAMWSGFLYCCLKQKKGTVLAEATKQPFQGFLVNPQWIVNLVQAHKLDTANAHDLLVQCVNGSRHIKDLQAYDQEMEKLAVRKAVLDAARQLGGTLKEQKVYPKVQAFLNQFKKPRHRYKFLVLAGPSRVGKTAFARSLCEPGVETLEVNCSSGAEPDLKAYRFRRHGLILFDEIQAEQVAAQRKLFQAQATPVQLACSATNCFSYEVFVWRKKLVLASNNWHSSLSLVSAPDRDWIQANSIVLDVLEAMWTE